MSDDRERNGLAERVRMNTEQVSNLWRDKASKESVATLKEEVRDLRKDMRDEVSGLRKVLIGASAAWLFGTLMFLIAALEFAQ